ncbi:uncharacterized protein LOC144770344 isoform X1 [Lissotriton helveticus]
MIPHLQSKDWTWEKGFLKCLRATKTPISEKCIIWENILEQINGVGRCTRNIEMLKKRWNDFKRKNKDKIIDKRDSRRMSFSHQKLSALEKKVARILQPEQMEELVQQRDQIEKLFFQTSHLDDLPRDMHTFKPRIGDTASQKYSAQSGPTLLHSGQVAEFAERFAAVSRTKSELSKQKMLSNLEGNVTTVLQPEQEEGLFEVLTSSSVRSRFSSQHRLSDQEKQVKVTLQSEVMELDEELGTSMNLKELLPQHRLPGLKYQLETVLHPHQTEGLPKDLDSSKPIEGCTAQHNMSVMDKQITNVVNHESEDLKGALKITGIANKIDAIQSPEHMDRLVGSLNISQTEKQSKSSLQLEQMGGSDSQHEQMEKDNLQTDDFVSSGSESAFDGTSLHMEEEEEVVQDEIEEEDVPESPSGKQHHIDEANKSDSGIIGCLDNAQKHIGSKSTAKEFQYHAAEHKEKESTDAEACHFREAEKRNKTAITGTTFHLGIESKTQPHKSTTLLKPQEDLTRDLSLQKGYAESERILQLVEKLKVFVDLQHKQYETLKCSVRQMNMHLCHQT